MSVKLENLKPCPFCGAEAVLVSDIVGYFGAKVTCTDCGVTMSRYDLSKEISIKEVINDWNRRTK